VVLVLIIISTHYGGGAIILETRLRLLTHGNLAPEGLVTREVVLVLEALETGGARKGVLSLRLE
jgi:hypothetical protein